MQGTINRAQGWEARDRIGEGGGEAKKSKKPQKSYRSDVENRGHLGGREAPQMPTKPIKRFTKKQIGKRKELRASERIVERVCPPYCG